MIKEIVVTMMNEFGNKGNDVTLNPDLKRHYLTQTKFTDPLNFGKYFDEIQGTIKEICELIRQQLIHPTLIHKFPGIAYDKNTQTAMEPHTVHKLMEELIGKDSRGFINDRTSENRLILSCRGYSILLVSILRHKGIPARSRSGFAPFVTNDGKLNDTWICESWDDETQRWLSWSPVFIINNFPKRLFHYPADVYLNYFNNSIDIVKYGAGEHRGMYYVMKNLIVDMLCVTTNEPWYSPGTVITDALDWGSGPHFDNAITYLERDNIAIFDIVARLMCDPDKNVYELRKIIENNKHLFPMV
jgi:hypothetical protein